YVGVLKSGSPTPSPITSYPCSFNSFAFAEIASVDEGVTFSIILDNLITSHLAFYLFCNLSFSTSEPSSKEKEAKTYRLSASKYVNSHKGSSSIIAAEDFFNSHWSHSLAQWSSILDGDTKSVVSYFNKSSESS